MIFLNFKSFMPFMVKKFFILKEKRKRFIILTLSFE